VHLAICSKKTTTVDPQLIYKKTPHLGGVLYTSLNGIKHLIGGGGGDRTTAY